MQLGGVGHGEVVGVPLLLAELVVELVGFSHLVSLLIFHKHSSGHIIVVSLEAMLISINLLVDGNSLLIVHHILSLLEVLLGLVFFHLLEEIGSLLGGLLSFAVFLLVVFATEAYAA